MIIYKINHRSMFYKFYNKLNYYKKDSMLPKSKTPKEFLEKSERGWSRLLPNSNIVTN